jgi:diguanylate cyclase (GGDEF)-like protein
MVDLDHFKNINDTYGHLAGDLVLQEVAKRIVASVRAYDSVGRYGGEEFLAVLSGCTARDLYTSAERIRTAIAASPVLFERREVSLTVSIGAVAALPGATAQQTLLAHADAALYRAKNSGRNRSELGEEVSPSTS